MWQIVTDTIDINNSTLGSSIILKNVKTRLPDSANKDADPS